MTERPDPFFDKDVTTTKALLLIGKTLWQSEGLAFAVLEDEDGDDGEARVLAEKLLAGDPAHRGLAPIQQARSALHVVVVMHWEALTSERQAVVLGQLSDADQGNLNGLLVSWAEFAIPFKEPEDEEGGP